MFFLLFCTPKIPLLSTSDAVNISEACGLYDMDDYITRLSQHKDQLGYFNYLSSKDTSFLRNSLLNILKKHFEMNITDADLSLVLLKFTLQYFSDLYFDYKIEEQQTLSDKLSLFTNNKELLIQLACRLKFWNEVSPTLKSLD